MSPIARFIPHIAIDGEAGGRARSAGFRRTLACGPGDRAAAAELGNPLLLTRRYFLSRFACRFSFSVF